MKKPRQYQSVMLTTNKYIDDNLKKGMLGTILEVYDDENYEIEWYDDLGNVIWMCAFHIDDFDVLE